MTQASPRFAALPLVGCVTVLALAVSAAERSVSPPLLAPLSAPNPLVMLLRSAEVQRELDLDASQARAVRAAVAEVDQPLWLLRDLPAEKRDDEVRRILEALQAKLHATLRPKQGERLEQLVFRSAGWDALRWPGVAERLQLSEKQRDQLASLLDEARKRDPKAISPQLTDAEQRRAMRVLSSSQQRRFTQLTGKAFDFSRVPQVAVEATELRDVTAWVNSEPITLGALRGKVVALHFYTFGCINCIHSFPHYKDWYPRFAGKPFVLLGLHTPETQGEHDVDAVRAAAQRAGLEFPIAVDGHASNWKAWGNHMWPSVYLIDKQGGVRYWWYGELNWEGAKGEEFMRGKIEELLAEKE